jgi:DNA-binding NtrC family response regulator
MATRKILVIENDTACGRMIESLLRLIDPSLEVVLVETAWEAAGKLALDDYVMVVADIFLDTQVTGIDLWEAYCKRRRHAPFVFTSSLEPGEFKDIVTKYGALPTYLKKPVATEHWRGPLETVLGLTRRLRG